MGTKEQWKKLEDDSCTARPGEPPGQIPEVGWGLEEKGHCTERIEGGAEFTECLIKFKGKHQDYGNCK